MKSRRETSPCARCPYHLGLIKTLISPCPQCWGGGLWTAEALLRSKHKKQTE